MKILLYCEPWIELEKPSWKDGWQDFFFLRIINILKAEIETGEIEILYLLGDAQENFILKRELPEKIVISYIGHSDLCRELGHYLDCTKKWYDKTYTNSSFKKMKKIVSNGIGDFIPDIIVSFVSEVPFLKKMFPSALVLNHEVGFAASAPFHRSIYSDPCGVFSNSFLAKFGSKIASIKISDEEKQFIEDIRDPIIKLIEEKSPHNGANLGLEKFKKVLLLPLGFSGYFPTDVCMGFNSQFDYLCYVLENIPKEYGLIVTQHNVPWWGNHLKDDVVLYLSAKYQNFIYRKEFDQYFPSSQHLMGVVDGVITTCSAVGYLALFWNKALFIVGKGHLNHFSDGGLEDMERVFDGGKVRDKTNIVYYLLTHYHIPEKYFFDPKFFKEYLSNSLNKFRNLSRVDINFEFYQKIDDIENIKAIYLNSIDSNSYMSN